MDRLFDLALLTGSHPVQLSGRRQAIRWPGGCNVEPAASTAAAGGLNLLD